MPEQMLTDGLSKIQVNWTSILPGNAFEVSGKRGTLLDFRTQVPQKEKIPAAKTEAIKHLKRVVVKCLENHIFRLFAP
jgi:hypothetical protein